MHIENTQNFVNLHLTVEDAFLLQAQLNECLRLVTTNKLPLAGSGKFMTSTSNEGSAARLTSLHLIVGSTEA